MSKLGQTAVKELFKELAYKFEIPFEEKCFEILSYLFTHIERVPPRGNIDSSGIDLFGWDPNTSEKDTFYQCKGFQIKTFSEGQFLQCKKSIDSFANSDKSTINYYLIINRPIPKIYIDKLNTELNYLKKKKKAKNVQLLDIYKFIDFIYNKQIETINKEISSSFDFFYKEFSAIMHQKFYYSNIPYQFNNKNLINPSKHILNRSTVKYFAKGLHPSEYVKGKYFFIISEFGFGKTSLMFKLYSNLIRNNFLPIYLPAAAFSSDGFASPSLFCKNIFKIINSENKVDFPTYNSFKSRVFKNILDNNPNIVLLIDGLDEHKFFKKDTNLVILFNWMREFKSIPIFSIRSEFWKERHGNFEMAIGKYRQYQDKIFLTDWENKDILKFIKLYTEKHKLNAKQKVRLNLLMNIIKSNNYSSLYGDIPKRPLFLEMIISDVINNKLQSRCISDLYNEFITNKIFHDRKGVFKSFTPIRELPFEVDFYKLKDIIFNILELCASKMYIVDDDKIILVNNIKSNDIEKFIIDFKFNDILDLLLHSVLVPSEERKSANINLKFAHYSFLEYFFARYVVSVVETDGKWLKLKYETTTLKFIKDILLSNGNKNLFNQFK